MVFFGFLFCYTTICGAVGDYSGKPKELKKADPQIGYTATTLLCVVYAVFCGIQIAYLFTGGIFVLPEGFTYAEYARRGFFELLAVTCFNLVIILLCTKLFGESRFLRGNLLFITVCTYVMIASSAYRMLLYIGTYHLTFLRLFVLLFLLIDAIILSGTIVYVYRKSFPLFAFSVVVITVCYGIFSFSRPDYYIASYQLKYDNEIEPEELRYLINDLSKDAAPAVLPLLRDYYDELQGVYLVKLESGYYTGSHEVIKQEIERYYDEIEQENKNRGIRDFNLSNITAYKHMVRHPIR